jgi:hypothetical protein
MRWSAANITQSRKKGSFFCGFAGKTHNSEKGPENGGYPIRKLYITNNFPDLFR